MIRSLFGLSKIWRGTVTMRVLVWLVATMMVLVVHLPTRSDSRLIKSTVLFRVPKFGPFSWTEEGDDSTKVTTKLSSDETGVYLQYGRQLRDIYVRASRLVPRHFEASAVSFVSSDSTRALQAVQAIGLGLYERGSNFEIPPIRRLQGSEPMLVRPCIERDADGAAAELDPSTQHERLALWNDFKRFFRVHSSNYIKDEDPMRWVYESAVETLVTSSAAYRDEVLLGRLKALGPALMTRDARPSYLAYQILSSHFARSREDVKLRIIVTDSDDVMFDAMAALTFSLQGSTPFPLPRVLSVELHDEKEVDPASSVEFVRIQQDFVSSTCSEEGEVFCEIDSFRSASRRFELASEDVQWTKTCNSPTSSPKSASASGIGPKSESEVSLTTYGHQEIPLARSDSTSSQSSSHAKDPQENVPPSTCNSASVHNEDADEAFVHGFLWGLALVASVAACRCSPTGKRHGQQGESASFDSRADPDMDAIDRNRTPDIEEGEGGEYIVERDDRIPISPNQPAPAAEGQESSSTTSAPSQPVASRSSGLIAHIPRPKPAKGSTNSPAVRGPEDAVLFATNEEVKARMALSSLKL